MQKRPYSLEEPNDSWAEKFNEVKGIIESVFGDKILSIHHIGSNSYGIKAKPLLDILVLVKDINNIAEEKNKMVGLGYLWEDNYIAPETSFVYKLEGDKKIENIHVVPVGHREAEKFLITKEYFISHPEKLKEYEDLKVELNSRFPDDYPAYRAGKNDFLQEVLKLAKEENK